MLTASGAREPETVAARTQPSSAARLSACTSNISRIPTFDGYRLSGRETLWCCAIILAFALINTIIFTRAIWTNAWILDAAGQIIPADFVSFWSTSQMLQMGPAHEVYDWTLHYAAEKNLLGPQYDGRLPWLNPPNFLLFVAPLALLPYPLAFLAWVLVTFTAYAAALKTIFPRARNHWILVGALAFPGAISTVLVGQNGFLTGALIAAILGQLERRPILAGCLLGLLTYKPQFGILFPVLLVATKRWHTLAAATATTTLLSIATTAAYGLNTWLAFWNSLHTTQEAILEQGLMGFHRLQSVYGLLVWWSGNATVAWIVQAVLGTAVAVSVVWIWRRQIPVDVKAASLGTAILLVTPYALIYDLVIFAVPIAFMIRAGLERGFGASEIPLITLACILILVFPLVQMPVGAVAGLILFFGIIQRAAIEDRGQLAPPR